MLLLCIIRENGGFVNMEIKIYCDTGFGSMGCYEETVEIPDKELEGMTESEKEEYIHTEYVVPFVFENIDAGYEEI